jgi:hypothetical protein
MSVDKKLDGMNFNFDLASKMSELKNSKDPAAREAMKSLSIVSGVMNSIMNGAQVDPVFIKKIIDDLSKRIPSEPKQKKIIKKKKKLSNKVTGNSKVPEEVEDDELEDL